MLKKMSLIFDSCESDVLTSWSCSGINYVHEWLLKSSIRNCWKIKLNEESWKARFLRWTFPKMKNKIDLVLTMSYFDSQDWNSKH